MIKEGLVDRNSIQIVFWSGIPEMCTPGTSHNSDDESENVPFFIKKTRAILKWEVGKKTSILAFRYKCFLREKILENNSCECWESENCFSQNSPQEASMWNLVYPRIPWFVNTVWMIQYSEDFLIIGEAFHQAHVVNGVDNW